MAAYNCVNCIVYICGSANYASLFAQMFPIVKLLCDSKCKKMRTRMLSFMDWVLFLKTAEFYCSEVFFFTISFDKSVNKVS